MSIVGSMHSTLRHQYDLPTTTMQKAASEATLIQNSNSFADKVTISFEAQQIAKSLQQEKIGSARPSSSASDLPNNFFNTSAAPDVMLEEALKYALLHENLAADGEISARDIEALQGYVDIMSSTNASSKI